MLASMHTCETMPLERHLNAADVFCRSLCRRMVSLTLAYLIRNVLCSACYTLLCYVCMRGPAYVVCCAGKQVLLLSTPMAFSPGCSNKHIPGYMQVSAFVCHLRVALAHMPQSLTLHYQSCTWMLSKQAYLQQHATSDVKSCLCTCLHLSSARFQLAYNASDEKWNVGA